LARVYDHVFHEFVRGFNLLAPRVVWWIQFCSCSLYAYVLC
jgi:hypothetical protein